MTVLARVATLADLQRAVTKLTAEAERRGVSPDQVFVDECTLRIEEHTWHDQKLIVVEQTSTIPKLVTVNGA